MHQVVNPPRIGQTDADSSSGRVVWSPVKSLWFTSLTLGAVIGGATTFSWNALLLYVVTTGAVLLLGHSLGMHRKLIHDSYQCPLWLEHFLVYCGILVGMAGPYGMVRTHDLRDWAQRQRRCHPYLANAGPMLRDAWWQLHCEIRLDHAPVLTLEPRIAHDRFYHFLERTWMLHHLFWAAVLYAWGGWAYLWWGTCARAATCIFGHWLVGYFAHNRGERTYHVEGAAAQGYNVRIAALITMGEAWHNNHHAFPGSARLGLYAQEVDPGWWLLAAWRRLGLVWDIKLPEDLPVRAELRRTTVTTPTPARAASAWATVLRRKLRIHRRLFLAALFIALYMLPFSLLFGLGLVSFGMIAGIALGLIYGPPFIALWAAVLYYPGFRKGHPPFDLRTREGRGMIAVLRYGVLAVPVSLLAGADAQAESAVGIFGFAGALGIPAALFASAVLFKAWKERDNPCW